MNIPLPNDANWQFGGHPSNHQHMLSSASEIVALLISIIIIMEFWFFRSRKSSFPPQHPPPQHPPPTQSVAPPLPQQHQQSTIESEQSGLQRITVDVGGQSFVTTLETLCRIPDTYFSAVIRHTNTNNKIYIDRDHHHFRHILNYLRDNTFPFSPCANPSVQQLREILAEAQFFCIEPLITLIKACLGEISKNKEEEKTSEKQFKLVTCGVQEVEEHFNRMTLENFEFVSMSTSKGCSTIPNFARSTFPKGEDVFMIFSKNLTVKEISFFDRIMSQ